MVPVERDQIPDFDTEGQEHEFWATHDPGPAMIEEFQRVAEVSDGSLPAAREQAIVRSHTRNLSVRFDLDTLNRLRRVAKKKGIGYKTLLKQFVGERLYEEEKREGFALGPS